MSNYPNMSYCMCENTAAALRQVVDAMVEEREFLEDLNRHERIAFDQLYHLCQQFVRRADMLVEQEEEADPGEMDGDHESALASAGFGTDEDYGCYDEA